MTGIRTLCILSVVLLGNAAAADWPQWRGPARDGKAIRFKAPTRWPEQLTQRWRIPVGEGHASPLQVGDAVYVFTREGNSEIARMLDASTGKERWRASYAAPYEMNAAAQGHGKGPKSTPTLSGGRLFTFGISGIVSAFDAKSGKRIWQREFSRDHKTTSPLYGAAASPLVADGLAIVHVGGHDDGALTAFDAATGRTRWRWTGDGPAYSSPILVTRDGVKQVVTQTQRFCVGVGLADGKLLWRLPYTTPYDQNSVTPVAAGNLLIFGGTQRPTIGVRLTRKGAAWHAEKSWETRDQTLYMSTPVFADGRLYGMSERRSGQLFTVEPATGKTLWAGDGRLGDNTSLTDIGSHVLALTVGGDLRVLHKDGVKLVEERRYEVASSATWASPAVVGRSILVKDSSHLTLWELPR